MIVSTSLELIGANREKQGTLELQCLPGKSHWQGTPVLVVHDSGSDSPSGLKVELLEETEYVYEFRSGVGQVQCEPKELFDPSSDDGKTGRLRTGRVTGAVTVVARRQDDSLIGRCEFEIRARKLDYLTEYRWMLQGIAEESAEIIQSEFAAGRLEAFRPQTAGDAESLYQRFAFIQALLASEEFQSAMQMILHRPHHDYRVIPESRNPALGMRPSRRLLRALTAPGPRHPIEGQSVGSLDTLPTFVEILSFAETYDTVPNRFVKYALEQWRSLALEIERLMSGGSGATASRGVREARRVREELEELLQAPLWHDVAMLDAFPSANTVLQGRPGYRDVFRCFWQAEAAAMIDWSGATETVFPAGQRNVATLYEYWVFLELLRIIEACSGFQVERKPLLRLSKDRLSLELRRGRALLLQGLGVARGRVIRLELWFNRSFKPSADSWTTTMRPDCSLRIRPEGGIEDGIWDGIWLHFDAKYRVHHYTEFMRDVENEGGGETKEPTSEVKTDDLLKMHAYRDAIRRTSGAFVLYPGESDQPLQMNEYHEILPGLGAFVLRPIDTGRAAEDSALSLRRFIEDVIDHVAAQGTDDERANYWLHRTYRERRGMRLVAMPYLREPAADARVLLGYLRSEPHQEWVLRTGLYNMRADGRRGSVGLDSPALASEVAVLYRSEVDDAIVCRLTGAFVLKTRHQLEVLGYPSPRGELYCCIELGDVVENVQVEAKRVRELARRGLVPSEWGSPCAVSWQEVVAASVGSH